MRCTKKSLPDKLKQNPFTILTGMSYAGQIPIGFDINIGDCKFVNYLNGGICGVEFKLKMRKIDRKILKKILVANIRQNSISIL